VIQLIFCCSLTALAQQPAEKSKAETPATWTRFYREEAEQHRVARDDAAPLTRVDHALFEWASINHYHGGVFAWSDRGRPAVVGTIFSFPRGTNQRLAVREFVTLSETAVTVHGPGGTSWSAPPNVTLRLLPEAPMPPDNFNLLKLHARRLAREFSASLNRRGERWELRLLPKPLMEYQQPAEAILGGALFAFVGYSTDPEILLLIEARDGKDGAAWRYLPLRFSDKSLYLKYKDKLVWESLRAGHGAEGPDTKDPHYHVLSSGLIPADVVEKLESGPAADRAD
jgi:hypothetical protein